MCIGGNAALRAMHKPWEMTMNRREVLGTSTIVALGTMLPGGVLAQAKSLKEQLVGTWTLISADTIDSNGTKLPLVKGTSGKGFQLFTADGKVSFQVIGDHQTLASNDRTKMTPEEMKAMAESVLSYFGTYTVNEQEKSFTMRIEASTFQNQTAIPAAKRMVELNGDDLKVTNPGRLAGGQNISVWKRA